MISIPVGNLELKYSEIYAQIYRPFIMAKNVYHARNTSTSTGLCVSYSVL